MKSIQTAERVSQADMSDNFVFQRSLLAYHKAAKLVSGQVCEIGTGSGYGISLISPSAAAFITIDKNACGVDFSEYSNVEFHQMNVPPFSDIESNSQDFVISFQVIEHVKNDFAFMQEVHRILRPGGKFIVSTPNKKMSLTRNPWHIREYTVDEFKNLTSTYFSHVEALGVFGNEKIMEYYRKNRKSVQRIIRFDIFNFQYILPRWILRVPYDILNRMNRRKLLMTNRNLTTGIALDDYYIAEANDACFDLYFIAEK